MCTCVCRYGHDIPFLSTQRLCVVRESCLYAHSMHVYTACFDLVNWTLSLFVCRLVQKAYDALEKQDTQRAESVEGRGSFSYTDWQHPYYMMLARELQLQDLQDGKGGQEAGLERLRDGEESEVLARSLLRGRSRINKPLMVHLFFADRLIKKGEELFTTYGHETNSELIGKATNFT